MSVRVRGVMCGKPKCKKVHTYYAYEKWREGGKFKEKYLGKFDPQTGEIEPREGVSLTPLQRVKAQMMWGKKKDLIGTRGKKDKDLEDLQKSAKLIEALNKRLF